MHQTAHDTRHEDQRNKDMQSDNVMVRIVTLISLEPLRAASKGFSPQFNMAHNIL